MNKRWKEMAHCKFPIEWHMFARILAQNCQTFDNFNFEISMSHHNAHYQSYKNAPIAMREDFSWSKFGRESHIRRLCPSAIFSFHNRHVSRLNFLTIIHISWVALFISSDVLSISSEWYFWLSKVSYANMATCRPCCCSWIVYLEWRMMLKWPDSSLMSFFIAEKSWNAP